MPACKSPSSDAHAQASPNGWYHTAPWKTNKKKRVKQWWNGWLTPLLQPAVVGSHSPNLPAFRGKKIQAFSGAKCWLNGKVVKGLSWMWKNIGITDFWKHPKTWSGYIWILFRNISEILQSSAKKQDCIFCHKAYKFSSHRRIPDNTKCFAIPPGASEEITLIVPCRWFTNRPLQDMISHQKHETPKMEGSMMKYDSSHSSYLNAAHICSLYFGVACHKQNAKAPGAMAQALLPSTSNLCIKGLRDQKISIVQKGRDMCTSPPQ